MIRKRDSIENFYWNENLPRGFFIKNGGEGAGNNGQGTTAALFAGSGQSPGDNAVTSGFGRSSIPTKPKAQVGFLFQVCTRF